MLELGDNEASSFHSGGPASWGSARTTWRALCSLYPRFWLKHWRVYGFPFSHWNWEPRNWLSLIQMYHAPQGIRMAEILGGRNIKSQSLSDSQAKLLWMCFCTCPEWLRFYLHTKLSSAISQEERAWKLYGDMLKSQASDFIPGSEQRLLKWLSSLTPAFLFRDRPAVSMLHYWCSEKSGQREVQIVCLKPSSVKTGASDPTPDSFCLLPCFRLVLRPQLCAPYACSPFIWPWQVLPLWVNFS